MIHFLPILTLLHTPYHHVYSLLFAHSLVYLLTVMLARSGESVTPQLFSLPLSFISPSLLRYPRLLLDVIPHLMTSFY